VEAVGGAGLWQVEIDVNHLESALVNLAINARDAMPGGGKLTLEAVNVFADEDYCRVNPELSPGHYVQICVSDTGFGMPPEIAQRAFEPFFTTKEVGQGTGLGLSQVYGFIKQSGGHVKIYSEPDHGTTIKILLPRYFGRAVDESPLEEEIVTGESSETLLVVEDDPDLRAYLVEVLRNLGYRVLAAADAQAALAILNDTGRRIDLLLTDIVMPGMDGRALAAQARKVRPKLRILHMTGYSRNALVQRGGRLEEGVDLLQKPIAQLTLSTKVRDMLDRKH
jgi:CheY-like chemotaxis protein